MWFLIAPLTSEGIVEENIKRVKAFVEEHKDKNIFAPHLYYPQFLSTENEEDQVGVTHALEILQMSEGAFALDVHGGLIRTLMTQDIYTHEATNTIFISPSIDKELKMVREYRKKLIVLHSRDDGGYLISNWYNLSNAGTSPVDF